MTTITKERLEKLIHAIECESYDEEEIKAWVSSDEIFYMARIALAALELETARRRFAQHFMTKDITTGDE